MKKLIEDVVKRMSESIVFEMQFREKMSFLKKVDVLKPYDSCSRMRVGDGFPKEQEIEKRGKYGTRTFQNHTKMMLEQ